MRENDWKQTQADRIGRVLNMQAYRERWARLRREPAEQRPYPLPEGVRRGEAAARAGNFEEPSCR